MGDTSKRNKHDQNKREISYENAILKFYNIQYLFSKFFHPTQLKKTIWNFKASYK